MKRRPLIVFVFLLAGAIVNVAVAWGCAAWGDVPILATRMGTLSEDLAPRWDLMWWECVGAARIEWAPVRFEGVEDWSPPSPDKLNKIWRMVSKAKIGSQMGVTQQFDWPEFEVGSTLTPNWGRMRKENVRSYGKQRHAYSLPANGPYERYFEDARGWPYLSLWAGITISKERGKPPVLVDRRYAIAGWGNQLGETQLPLLDLRFLPYGPIWPAFVVNTLFYAVVLWLLCGGPFVLWRFIRIRRGLCPACGYPEGQSDVCSECGKALPERAGVAM